MRAAVGERSTDFSARPISNRIEVTRLLTERISSRARLHQDAPVRWAHRERRSPISSLPPFAEAKVASKALRRLQSLPRPPTREC
jgi:hypothetical protein